MQHRGGPEYAYRLRLSRPQPDFQLRVVPPSISARAGASVPITVYALRKDGFADEITLTLKDAPPGFALSGNRLPGDKEQVPVTLSVPSAALNGPFSLSLEGRATIQGREVSRAVVPAEDMMQAFAYRHLVPAQELKVAVSGRDFSRSPVRVIGDSPTRIPAGGIGRILLGVPPNVAPERIDLKLSDPPEGISIQSVTRSREGVAVLIQSDAAKVKLGQKGNLILTATGKKFGSASSNAKPAKQKAPPTMTLPAVPYEIVGQGER
jgi:hypothetical protein